MKLSISKTFLSRRSIPIHGLAVIQPKLPPTFLQLLTNVIVDERDTAVFQCVTAASCNVIWRKDGKVRERERESSMNECE